MILCMIDTLLLNVLTILSEVATYAGRSSPFGWKKFVEDGDNDDMVGYVFDFSK